MDCKEGQFDVVEAFNINLNAQHVNEMTFLIVENQCTVM